MANEENFIDLEPFLNSKEFLEICQNFCSCFEKNCQANNDKSKDDEYSKVCRKVLRKILKDFKNAKFTTKGIEELIKICDNASIMHKPSQNFHLLAHLSSCLHKYLPVVRILSKSSELIEKFESTVEIKKNLSLIEFIEEFYRKKPVLIKNYNADTKVWTFENLLENYHSRHFPIEIGKKYTDENWQQEILPFKDFYKQFIQEISPIKGYIAQFNLLQLDPYVIKQLPIPDYCQISEREVEINFWIGPSGTVSPVHFDKRDNIFSQLQGSKLFHLFDPKNAAFDLCPGFSNTGKESLNEILQKMPNDFVNVAQVDEGDLLYIPEGWWHHVESLSCSISVSFWM